MDSEPASRGSAWAGRATTLVSDSARAANATVEQLVADTQRLTETAAVHEGIGASLEQARALTHRIKRQHEVDVQMRNFGLLVLALVIAYILFERVFLTLGGGFLLRGVWALAWAALGVTGTAPRGAAAPPDEL